MDRACVLWILWNFRQSRKRKLPSVHFSHEAPHKIILPFSMFSSLLRPYNFSCLVPTRVDYIWLLDLDLNHPESTGFLSSIIFFEGTFLTIWMYFVLCYCTIYIGHWRREVIILLNYLVQIIFVQSTDYRWIKVRKI